MVHFKYERTRICRKIRAVFLPVSKNFIRFVVCSCIFTYHRANRKFAFNFIFVPFSDSMLPQRLNQASKYFLFSYRAFKFVVRFSWKEIYFETMTSRGKFSPFCSMNRSRSALIFKLIAWSWQTSLTFARNSFDVLVILINFVNRFPLLNWYHFRKIEVSHCRILKFLIWLE